jgi:hypothetical protein
VGRIPGSTVLAVGVLWCTLGALPTLAQQVDKIELKPPLPVWPSELETITDRSPAIRMNGRFGASRYRIEVARNAVFESPTTIDDGFQVSGTDLICPTVLVKWPGPPLADGQYYWRAFCAGLDGVWTPPANYRTFFVSGIDADAVKLPSNLPHPYLMFSADQIPSLREKIKSSPHYERTYRYLYNAAVAILDAKPPDEDYARASKGQHGNYLMATSWYSFHLTKLAFVWRISGEERFAIKAQELLLSICRFQQWVGQPFMDKAIFDPNWTSTLETAGATYGVAIGYDLLYERLTPAERQMVRSALVTKGVRPLVRDWTDPVVSSKIPRHQTATGNWVMVCAGAAGVGALAVMADEPEAAQWLRLVRNRIRWWPHDRGGDWFVDNPNVVNRPKPIPVIGPSEPNFDADGGYKESHGYMNYAMTYVCYFGDAFRRVTGEDIFKHVPANLLDTIAWSMFVEEQGPPPRVTGIDFGDCVPWVNNAVVYSGLMKNRADGLAQWLYHRTVGAADSIAPLVWQDERVSESAPALTLPMKHFRGIGQVLMRSGWRFDDLVVGVKFHQNRGHHDLGTFCIARNGPAVIDSGATDYTSPVYHTYLAQSHAHNVILVDGQGQQKTDGKVLAALATPNMAAATGQLAAAYPDTLKSWSRTLVFLPPGIVATVDLLEGKGPHRYEYVLHPNEAFQVEPDGQIRWGQRNHLNFAKLLLDAPPVAKIEDGYRWTNPRKYVKLSRPGEPRESDCLAAVIALGVALPECKVKEARGGDGRGALVLIGAKLDPAAYACDAQVALLAVDEGSHSERFYLHAGKRLARGDEALLNAGEALDAVVERNPSGIVAEIQTPQPGTLSLSVAETVAGVTLDDAAVAYTAGERRLTASIPAGSHQLAIQYHGQPAVRTRCSTPVHELAPLRAVDAPAFTGALARADHTWNDPAAAIDGNPNTMWYSLPYVAMPQWFEVELPQPRDIREITIDTVLPSKFELLACSVGSTEFRSLGSYATTPESCEKTIPAKASQVTRLRVVFQEIEKGTFCALIRELTWR